MTAFLAFLALSSSFAHQTDAAQTELGRIRDALASGQESKVAKEFAVPAYSKYLFEMAGRQRGKLAALKVNVIPVPPGWERTGSYWAVFHSYLEIELDHDPVFPLIKTGDGLKLGEEIPEFDPGNAVIVDSTADVHLRPTAKSVDILASLKLTGGKGRASIFRMNDIYRVEAGTIDGKAAPVVVAGETVPSANPGELVSAGGLLIPWTSDPIRSLTAQYTGIVDQEGDDAIGTKTAYLTSWWVPTLAQLPHSSSVRVAGPKDWEIRSEGAVATDVGAGFGGPPQVGPDEKSVTYRCELPISFPKVVAGKYALEAESTVNGVAIREYQVDPVEPLRAKADVQRMGEALKVYEKYLGPFPFPSYECFDSGTYYGIESYSYTLLKRDITSWACSHEMGHTYFGGLVPCAYVRDSWNEGMTQYIDSVVFGKDADRSLEGGLATMRVAVPLSRMNVCWDYASASYFRGAYVMKMLEAEIGFQNVMDSLKDIVVDRRGKDTAWDDLRPYFEKRAGRQLDWYWNQWIDGATYPTLTVVDATTEAQGGGFLTRVTVHQAGSETPLHLRYAITLTHGGDKSSQVVQTTVRDETFDVTTSFKPTRVGLDLFGYTMATGGKEIVVGK